MPRTGKNGPKKLSLYGAWLRFLRKEAKLTQMELSNRTGIRQTTISAWEKRGDIRGRKEILAMCDALNVKPETLLRAKDIPRPLKNVLAGRVVRGTEIG